MLTIVMYHYVRKLAASVYPQIKGLDTSNFKTQIQYFKKYYHPISAYDLMDSIEHGVTLPPNSILLTFDDGYIDHFSEVFPILEKENISGCFFPPTKCITQNTVLDVNKIHFILASVEDKSLLINHILHTIQTLQSEYKLDNGNDYWIRYGIESRFDSAEVIFIKRMLQKVLPETLRIYITNQLFQQFVTKDEKSFAKDLYMNPEQLAFLQSNGMYVGSHGYNHYWLDSISESMQENEIELSLQFLEDIGSSRKRWIMCYPYGAYNESLLSILKKKNCVAGLTTKSEIANLNNPLQLSRLDTNDFPIHPVKEANFWTKKAIELV